MKKLQQLFASVVLTLLLSVSVFADDGTIWPMLTAPTPTPTSDPVAEVALSLLQGVLALF